MSRSSPTVKRLNDNHVHLALVFAPMILVIVLIVIFTSRDDPATIEATKGEPGVEFMPLPESQRMYRMIHHRSGQRAYFTLLPEERLTAPVLLVPCDGFLPSWIPPFAKADQTACLVLRTNQRERRRLSSFLVKMEDVVAAYEFYNKALGEPAGFSQLANGMLPNETGDIRAIVEYRDGNDARRASIDYYRSSPELQAAVAVEF